MSIAAGLESAVVTTLSVDTANRKYERTVLRIVVVGWYVCREEERR